MSNSPKTNHLPSSPKNARGGRASWGRIIPTRPIVSRNRRRRTLRILYSPFIASKRSIRIWRMRIRSWSRRSWRTRRRWWGARISWVFLGLRMRGLLKRMRRLRFSSYAWSRRMREWGGNAISCWRWRSLRPRSWKKVYLRNVNVLIFRGVYQSYFV